MPIGAPSANSAVNRDFPASIGWILIAFGLFFLSAAIWNDARRAVFGQFAEGQITRVTERVSSDRSSRRSGESRSQYRARSRSSSGGISYILTVHFTPAGGPAMDVDTLATWGHSETVGQKVRMIYLPDDPEGAEIYSVKQVWLPLATGFTVATLCLVGGVFIVRRRRRS